MRLEEFVSKIDNTIKYTADLSDAIEKIYTNQIDYLVFLREKLPFGILTKKDILKLIQKQININTPLSSVVNTDIIQISLQETVEYAFNLFVSFNIKYLFVVDKNGSYIGIIEKNNIDSLYKIKHKMNPKLFRDIVNKTSSFITLPYPLKKVIDEMCNKNKDIFLVGNDKKIEGIITKNNIFMYIKQLNLDEDIKTILDKKMLIIDIDEDTNEILSKMKKENFKFLTLHDKKKNTFYSLSLNELYNIYKTPHEIFLETKLTSNHMLMNKLDSAVIEVFKVKNTFIVGWLNEFAKKSFNINVNSQINNLLPSHVWDRILEDIKSNKKVKDIVLSIFGIERKIVVTYFIRSNLFIIKLLINENNDKNKQELIFGDNLEKIKKKHLYHSIFYQKSIGIAYLSPKGTILDINPYIEDFIGYRKDEVLGKNNEFFTHEDDVINSQKTKAYMVENSISNHSLVRRYVRKDKTIVWAFISLNSIFDKEGNTKYFMIFLQDYTKYYETQQDLIYQKEILSTIFATVEDFIFYKDSSLRYVSCNNSMLKYLDLELKDVVGKDDYDLFPKEIADSYVRHNKEAIKKKDKIVIQQTHIKKDETMVAETILKPRFDKDNNLLGIVGAVHNITSRFKYESRQRLIHNVFQHTDEGIVVTNFKSIITTINPAYTKITGYSADEVIGKKPSILASQKHNEIFYEKMWKSINETGTWKGEMINRKKNGELYPQLLTISTIKDENEKVLNYVGIFTDITDIKENQKKLEFLAHHDPLTKLPNKIFLQMNLDNSIKKAMKNNYKVAILFFDLDHFKEINDAYGHSTGDKVLVQVTNRLKNVLRDSDFIARVGGDEFIVMVEDFYTKDKIKDLITKIFHVFSSPYIVDERIFNISCTLGASIFPEDGTDAESLIKNADAAMYKAKKAGRNNYKFYTPDITDELFKKVETLADIRRAIKNEEFTLYYQPQLELATKKIIGVEALARWEHPIKGLLFPDVFIPLSEESHLIIHIGRQLVKKTCKDIKRWLEKGISLDNFKVAINISAVQIAYDDVYNLIKQTTQEVGISPKYLEIELTETSIMYNPEGAIALFNDIISLGVSVAIDDFGTGYSSLAYLKKFAIDKIKIDRSFVMDIPQDKDDVAITKAVLALGRNMNIDIIAEGIEEEEQRDFLLKEGCKKGQGYLFSKPLHVKDLEENVFLNDKK